MNKIYACNTCEAISGTNPKDWNQDWHYNVSQDIGTAKRKCKGQFQVYFSQDYLNQSMENVKTLCGTAKYAFPDNKKLAEDICDLIHQAFERLKQVIEKGSL